MMGFGLRANVEKALENVYPGQFGRSLFGLGFFLSFSKRKFCDVLDFKSTSWISNPNDSSRSRCGSQKMMFGPVLPGLCFSRERWAECQREHCVTIYNKGSYLHKFLNS